MIKIDITLTKFQLLVKVKAFNCENTFILNEIIRVKGRIPLCLSPHHPDLNATDLLWRDIKGELARM